MIQPEIRSIRKVKRGTLKNQVILEIKDLILSNQMRPGQPIIIDKLAEGFGVSHTPVREALVMLERDGLVELNSYKNPKVAEVTAKDVREVYEMRLMVESWAIERAAINLTQKQIDHIDQTLQLARKEAQVKNYVPHLKADLLLHETILKSTNNDFFWKLAERIHEHSIHVRALVEAKGTERDIIKIIDEHCLIMDALRAHDPIMARKSMTAHLEAGYERTLSVLAK